MPRACLAWAVVLTLSCAGLARPAVEEVDYERQVKPLLKQRCYACHGALKQQGGLRLDTGASIRAGGGSGAAVQPGDAGQSLLLQVVRGEAGFTMPPEGEGTSLTKAEIALLTRWVEQGAPSPEDEEPEADPQTFWSYQPVTRPAVPTIQNAEWAGNPIDAFIAAEHEQRGLSPRPPADRAVLLRRVYLDLIGIPPTRDELRAFLADDRLDAYERVVEQLLNSPLYGQRWGRHWMDVWRYSDWYGSRGINEIRYSQRHIWRWRDWIVESLNADHGYDRMVQEMLAGDELAPGDDGTIRATGFLGRNWYKFDRNVWMFETTEQTAQAFLGVTMRCCRCHDHKFDPLPQQDYYRFRAFFEPHDVRTDPISGDLGTERDATLGPVLQHGVSLAYDKNIDVKTFLFKRGDSRYPDETQPVSPGVPAAFGLEPPAIAAVALPPAGWFPVLKPQVVSGLRVAAAEEVAQANATVQEAVARTEQNRQRLAEIAASEAAGQTAAAPAHGKFFHDDFAAFRPDAWKIASGQWDYVDGHLVQANTGAWITLLGSVPHPRDFAARVRYRTLEAGAIHSVGVTFDAVETRDGQAVYSATNNTASTIQAFHRQNGIEEYPAAGIIPWPIKLGELITVDIAARGQRLNVWVNGELAIAYTMPMARRDGTFNLWTHAGSAEFHELSIDELPEDFRLAEQASEKIRSPFVPPTKTEFERTVALDERHLNRSRQLHEIALAEQQSLEAVLSAEQAKVAAMENGTTATPARQAAADAAARLAAAAQRKLAVLKAALEVQQAEQAVADARQAEYAAPADQEKAVAEVQKKLDAGQAALTAAEQAAAKDDGAYTPLGTAYPQTSTGRRTALARWITDPRNPRTARVAVNHIWLRHFGEGLVPTVSNFGLNGTRPTHPALLDWLAVEFTDHAWSMKHIHRLLVTSKTYRQATTDGDGPAAEKNLATDPNNRYLWRMNSRRMEAEVVRDSVLALADKLDLTAGGPEILETLGEQNNRRSLYFRTTPNEQMKLLEVFDRANPNECYRRQESVVPQQALALSNSLLSMQQAQQIAQRVLAAAAGPAPAEAAAPADLAMLVQAAFETVLSRAPSEAELAASEKLLDRYRTPNPPGVQPIAVEMLIHVLLNHNDFVTIR
ncbi:MAG: PSD1 and planctomycete cytochrome C domain-containing protein [Pirellulales bacterium]